MNIILYDNTYKIVKSHKLKCDDVNAIAYMLDISTDRKGPIFTIVKDPICELKNKEVSIAMHTSYAPIDIPFSDSTVFTSHVNIDSIESYYNVYPLIKQMIAFNSFIELNGYYIDNQLYINSIMVEYENIKVTLDEFDSDKKIRKTFKHLSMLTDVNKFMDDNEYIIFYNNGHWEFSDEINLKNKKIKYIFKTFKNLECGYLFTRKEFMLLSSIQELNIVLRYELKHVDDFMDSMFELEVPFNSFDEILQACIFIPQLILIEKSIYDEAIYLELILHADNYPFKLLVTDEEITSDGKNTCVFELLRDLMKTKL